MHVIAKPIIDFFVEKYPNSETSLRSWYKIMKKQDFSTFAELKQFFPSADWVDKLIVFNIGGNKYRLIASIHFNCNRVFIRHILTHTDYDKNHWKG